MPESFEVRISFPLFTLTEDGDSVMILGFDEEDVCPLFRSKELAELYIEQSGQPSLTCLPLPTPVHRCSILRAIETEVDRVVWNPTVTPQNLLLDSVSDLLDTFDA